MNTHAMSLYNPKFQTGAHGPIQMEAASTPFNPIGLELEFTFPPRIQAYVYTQGEWV